MYKYNNFPVSFKIIKNENYSKKKYDSAYCPNISLLIKYFMCSVVILFLGIQFFIILLIMCEHINTFCPKACYCIMIWYFNDFFSLQLYEKLLKIVDKTIFPQDFSNLSSNILAYKLIMNCVFIWYVYYYVLKKKIFFYVKFLKFILL